jgi:hypothetical protein
MARRQAWAAEALARSGTPIDILAPIGRTQQTQILDPVVAPVAVAVVQLQRDGLLLPQRQATMVTTML